MNNEHLPASMPQVLANSLSGTIRRFFMFPSHSITAKLGIAQAVHGMRTRRAAKLLRQQNLEKLLGGKDPAALGQDPADLVFLKETIKERKVRRAIEFGSGQSTIFIAQGMFEQGFGRLFSLDADKRWLAHSEKALPEHLRDFVTFVHSPAIVNYEYGVPAWEYSVIPEGDWDFVLVDGPALTDEVQLSCDLIKLVPALKPGATGMIDHRWRSAVLAKDVAGNQLRISYKPSLESFVFERVA